MLTWRRCVSLSLASGCACVTLLTGTAYSQASDQQARSADQTGAAQGTQAPRDLAKQVSDISAENAAIREQLRQMQEQQKNLTDTIERLQRRLEAPATAGAPSAEKAAGPASSVPPPAAQPGAAPDVYAELAPGAAKPGKDERYQDGIVIWQTPKDDQVPFLLKFNLNTQIRYLNTESSNDTYTDHLGVVRDVHKRNDITVNRSMFILGGYIFDPRLRYSSTLWTSAGAASIVVAGNIGWQFNKALTLTGGYTGVPGSRSLVNTFPFFTSTDRTMADNFFRPGFTQGLWANGELSKGLYYLAFLGNGLNTLNVSAAKIDAHLLVSGSVWWEPLGDFGPPGKSRNMYDDYFATDSVRVRLGTAFTRSREDRFSNLDQSSPENTSLYNSDGVLSFSTGAFAPGVTVQTATYRMWAIDAGLKWKGLAINGQYFFRWLDDFVADGPLPLSSTFDQGFELVGGAFVIPRKLMVYGRGSMVFGQFRDSWEAAGGVKWYFLPTERVWLTAELMRTTHTPYSGTFTPYTAGMTAWVPMIQTVLAF